MKLKLGAWTVFLIGYGFGILTTYNFFKDRYEKKAEADAKSVREHFEYMYGKKPEKEKDDEETKDQTLEVRSSLSMSDTKHAYEGKYHYKMTDPAERESPKEEDIIDDDEDDEPRETDIDDYISNTKYGKMSLTYFTEDKTLARNEYNENDGEEELIDDEYNYLGNVLDTSGFRRNDVPSIYVRNPRTQTIYEVTKCFGKYIG